MAKPFTFRLPNFAGGLNAKDATILIGDNQASDLRNVDFDGAESGALKKRNGSAYLNSPALVGSSGIKSIYRAWFSDANSIIIVSSDTRTLRYVGPGFTALGAAYTANQRFGFTMFNGFAIYGNATETTKKLSSAGVESALGGSPPNAKYFASWQRRVWASGNIAFPSRLFFSALDNEADWTTSGDAGNIDIDKEDGDYITGILPQGNRLLIFKNFKTYALYWTSPQSNRVELILHDIGTISGPSAVDVDGVALFLHGGGSKTRGVYALSMNSVKLMSDFISPILEQSSATDLQNACAGRYKDSYWLAVNNGGGATNNVIYTLNLKLAAWSYYTGIPAASMYSDTRLGTDRLLLGHATLGNIILPDTGTSDPGPTAINFYWRSKHFSFGVPELRKSVHRVHLMGNNQAGTVTVDSFINGLDTTWNQAITFSGGADVYNFVTLDVDDTRSNANTFALQIAANTTSAVTVYTGSIEGSMEEIGRDGD